MILHLWEQPGFVIQLRDAAAEEHRVSSENETPLWGLLLSFAVKPRVGPTHMSRANDVKRNKVALKRGR